jgi:hypothetical protein
MDAPLNPPPPPEGAPSEPSSLLDRLTNVITAPGEVFEEIKNRPVQTSNWLVPLFLVCLASVFYAIMAFSQPAVVQGILDSQTKAMHAQVAAGKITQAQADQAAAGMEKIMTPALMKIIWSGIFIFTTVAALFCLSFAIWGLLKLCTNAQAAYMKIIEVYGLALVIDLLQKIVRAWLVSWKENMLVTVSPTLFLDNPNMLSKRDIFLTLIDPIDFWWLAVLSLGVSKVASIRYRTAVLITAGVWFGLRTIGALLMKTA